jgi:branched-chain amino acid transport system substrate-binding protein
MLLAMAITTGYAQKEPSTIKVGVLLDLTGPIGPGGIDMEKGIRLAAEQAGDIGGKKLELIVADSATDAGVALDKTRLLVETDKVAAIIGPIYGGGIEAIEPYIERFHVPQFQAMGASNTGIRDWTFAPIGMCVEITYGAGLYAHDMLHYKTAVTLAADFIGGHEFIDGFKMGFEASGGKVIQETWYPEGTTNMAPFLTALEKADVVVFWGTPGDVFAFYPQYRELNIKMPVLQPEDGGVTSSPAMEANLGKSTIGAVFGTIYLYNADTPGNKEFVQAYQAKYKQMPGVMSGVGFAHMQILIAALRATNGDVSPDVLYKAIKAVSMDTIRGHVNFPADQGGFGLVASFQTTMGKIGPNGEIQQLPATYTTQIHFKDGQFLPSLVK